MRFGGSLMAFAACIAAAGCTNRAPQPTPAPPVATPAPTPTPTPTSAPVSDWLDVPQTPGDWYYRAGGGTTRALFGDAGADARFAITCNPAQRTITLARAGNVAGTAQMRILTEFGDRTIGAAASANAIPSIDARVGATDSMLDAMAFSKGRFAVLVAGLEPLYLPSWPEVTRVIEDCRR